jgi:hypothetical protein
VFLATNATACLSEFGRWGGKKQQSALGTGAPEAEAGNSQSQANNNIDVMALPEWAADA